MEICQCRCVSMCGEVVDRKCCAVLIFWRQKCGDGIVGNGVDGNGGNGWKIKKCEEKKEKQEMHRTNN